MTGQPNIEVERLSGYCLIALSGDVDLATSPGVKARLGELLAQGEQKFLFDMASVEHVDTTGLGLLVWLHKQTEQRGRMCLCGARSHLRKVLELTGLATIFALFDSRQEAERFLLGTT